MFRNKELPVFVTAAGLLCGCQILNHRPLELPPDLPEQPTEVPADSPAATEDRLPNDPPEVRTDYFRAEKQDAPADPPPLSSNSSFALPLWQDNRNAWLLAGNASQSGPPPETVFATTPPPTSSWTAGTTYQHRLDNGWIAGVGAGVEPTGKPTGPIPVKEVLNATFQVPQGDHAAWLLHLNRCSTDRSPSFRVEHVWQPTAWFQADTSLTMPVSDRSSAGVSLNLTFKLQWPKQP